MSHSLPLQGTLLLSDLDGTLLSAGVLVPKRSIDAIQRFKELGGLMGVATGRTEVSAGRFTGLFAPNAPGVVYNGSGIYDFQNDRFLWRDELGREAGELLAVIMREFPELGVEIYTEGCIYLLNDSPDAVEHMVHEALRYEIVKPEKAPAHWFKILFVGKEERINQLEDYVGRIKTTGVSFTRSCEVFYEMLPQSVSKGAALKKLAEILHISIDNIFAIGDYYNDIELLKAAGTGFTVIGAPDDVKSVADAVVGSCEDGAVADAVELILRQRAPEALGQAQA